MSDFKQPHEVLSAVMDGEASEFESHKIYKQLLSNPEVLAKWQRYQCVSGLLDDATKPFAHIDVSAAVRAAVTSEDTYQGGDLTGTRTPALKQKSSLLKSLSVAASVAFAVLVGVKYLPDLPLSGQVPAIAGDHQQSSKRTETAPSSVNVPVVVNNNALLASHEHSSDTLEQSQSQFVGLDSLRSQAVTETLVANKEQRSGDLSRSLNRFRHYLLKHAQQAAMASGQGLMPFARVLKLNEATPLNTAAEDAQQ